MAFWAERYGLRGNKAEAITSADIDFWGSRDDLKATAAALHRRARFPGEYEMTVWVGAFEWTIHGKRTLVEFLHTVPGLDTNDPVRASVEREYASGTVRRPIQILTAISLALTKLHALRHFKQDGRDDELHLRICLSASSRFICELLEAGEIRLALWNCERLIAASQMKPYRRLETEYGFDILSAIPVAEMQSRAKGKRQSEENRQRLAKFVQTRWKQIISDRGEPERPRR